MTQDDDWSDLSKAWTAPGPEAEIDTATIADVKRRDALSRLNFGLELLVSAAATVFLIWAIAAQVMTGLSAIATFGFIAFATVMTLWSRRRAPDLDVDTPAGALKTAVAQARSGQRWAWSGLAICAAAAIFLAIAAGSLSHVPASFLTVLGAGAAFILVWIVTYALHIRSSGRRLSAYTKALAALETESE